MNFCDYRRRVKDLVIIKVSDLLGSQEATDACIRTYETNWFQLRVIQAFDDADDPDEMAIYFSDLLYKDYNTKNPENNKGKKVNRGLHGG